MMIKSNICEGSKRGLLMMRIHMEKLQKVNGDETQKFVIELSMLPQNPEFLCLLAMAKKEYGFKRKALTLPGRLQEL
ncbi:hypothetical protein WN943_003617 [Citrus x changshan-huyou]